MISKNISVIVVGSLHTDIIALGVGKILGPGEYTHGKELKIGPGGKSRNIAQMVAALTDRDTVAMIAKTSTDPYNLWKAPVEALEKAGVNIEGVQILPFAETQKFPGVTLIPVDTEGNNQIYVLSGIAKDFSPKDIDNATSFFETVKNNNGCLALTLELPLLTALYALKIARKYNLRVLLDPGGIDEAQDYTDLLSQDIFLFKPNEHEARILTGITVVDFESAKKAAQVLFKSSIKNVFITHGKYGGYLFNSEVELHIPVPEVKGSGEKDETGCGDQALAAICASLLKSEDIIKACKIGLLAGTLQFGKSGIVPITKEELVKFS